MKEKQSRKIQPKVINSLSGKFTNFTHKGNVNSAIKLLANKLLKEKHPESAEVAEDNLLSIESEFVHIVKHDYVNAELVQWAALKTRRELRQSELDAGDVYCYQTALGYTYGFL